MATTAIRNFPYPNPTGDGADVSYWMQRLAEALDTDVDALATRIASLEGVPATQAFFKSGSLAPSWESKSFGVSTTDPATSSKQVSYAIRQRLLVNTPFSFNTSVWTKIDGLAIPTQYRPSENITGFGSIDGPAGFGPLYLRVTPIGEIYARALTYSAPVGQHSSITGDLAWLIA